MTKLIKVSDETYDRLQDLKERNNCKSFDKVIVELLHIHLKYNSSTIVRVINEARWENEQ